MTVVMGINKILPLPNHDSGVTIVKDGKIVSSVQEERITRVKHDGSVPYNSIKESLRIAGMTPDDVDAIAISTQYVSLPFGRELLRYGVSPEGFVQAFPVAFLRSIFVKKIKDYFGFKCDAHFVNHHRSHAAATYFTSGFDKCVTLVLDGGGDYRSGGIFRCEGGEINDLGYKFPTSKSMGYFYSSIADVMGFHPTDGEGKVMGLASYGNPVYQKDIEEILRTNKYNVTGIEIDITDKKKFTRYRYDRLYLGDKFKHMITGDGRDLAASAQKILEDEVMKLLRKVMEKEEVKNLALGGGTFFNCKLNRLIRENMGIENVFIHPACGDSGVQTGAALDVCRKLDPQGFKPERMEHVYYGTGYNDEEVLSAIKSSGLTYEPIKDPSGTAADLISKGMVVGWFQGRMEYGPRALGNRSVIVDPTNVAVKEKLNNALKQRDWFMPFAPSMLDEAKGDYLVKAAEAPFMIMAFEAQKEAAKDIPAVVHVDGTMRPQTVKKETNERWYGIIKEFSKTKVPVILNTSFNKHGLPIVNTPEDALEHLIWRCIDVLVIGDYMVERKLN